MFFLLLEKCYPKRNHCYLLTLFNVDLAVIKLILYIIDKHTWRYGSLNVGSSRRGHFWTIIDVHELKISVLRYSKIVKF